MYELRMSKKKKRPEINGLFSPNDTKLIFITYQPFGRVAWLHTNRAQHGVTQRLVCHVGCLPPWCCAYYWRRARCGGGGAGCHVWAVLLWGAVRGCAVLGALGYVVCCGTLGCMVPVFSSVLFRLYLWKSESLVWLPHLTINFPKNVS